MAELYFVAFRLAQDSTHGSRYAALEGVLADAAGGKWWKDPTSFIVFRSALKIDEVANLVADAIRVSTDIAIIGTPDFKSARVVGDVEDDDLFELWPWIKAS